MEENRENREYCARIARELDEIARGNCYKCPECGEVITFDNGQYNQGSEEYTCKECGKTFPEYELEAYTICDWLCDVLDYEITIDSRLEYKSAKIWVTLGGPNVWIDTAEKAIKLAWGTDRAEYPVDSDTCEEIDEYMQDLYTCQREG